MKVRIESLSLVVAALLTVSGAPVQASKAVDEAADRLSQRYLARKPMVAVPSVVFAEGGPVRVRDAFVARLEPHLGPPVGYKIAFATPQMQAMVGVTEPSYGVMLRDMLVQSGTTLPPDFAVNPHAEGDLLVRIGSDAINKARNKDEALAALDAVHGFIELPDLMYAPTSKEKYGPSSKIAVNLGARVGVMGEAIPLEKGQKGLDQIGKLKVTLLDATGKAIAASTELDTPPNHPLDGLLWLRDALRKDGRALKAGDLVSLGTFTRPLPFLADVGSITARYEGLRPGKPVEVTVRFAQERQEDQRPADQKPGK